jgi:hypothetical protein
LGLMASSWVAWWVDVLVVGLVDVLVDESEYW